MDFHQLFTSRQSGPACFINCRSCGAAIREHFDHAAGHGVLGWSGHTDDCDFVKAGLTVDMEKQDAADELAAFNVASAEEQNLYKKLKADADASQREYKFLDAYVADYIARQTIRFKRREREHV